MRLSNKTARATRWPASAAPLTSRVSSFIQALENHPQRPLDAFPNAGGFRAIEREIVYSVARGYLALDARTLEPGVPGGVSVGDKPILVTGNRHWNCTDLAERIVNRLIARYGYDLVVFHGGACGVDQAFAEARRHLAIKAEPHVADWRGLGNIAGPARNRVMV